METTVKQTKNILGKILEFRITGGNPPPVMLWGAPGIGKSDIVKSIALERGLELQDIRLAQLDPVDLRGVPTVENGQTRWAAPSCFRQDKDSAGIIFLDELSAADPSIQVAAYQLLLDRRIGDYVVPEKWMIVAAGNRAEDNAVSLPISSALANRMMHLELKVDPEGWLRWANCSGIAPEICGFIRFRPQVLFVLPENCERGWASPRSWENVSKILALNLDNAELASCVAGLIGENAAAQFLTYRKQFQMLGNIREMMLNETDVPELSSNKMDVYYAVASAIAYWVSQGCNDHETSLLLNGFFRISMTLPATFAVVAMLDVMETDKTEIVDALVAHPDFENWSKRFGNEMEKMRRNE